MPHELLWEIAHKQLPLVLTDPDDIIKLRVLSDAGFVIAQIPGFNSPLIQAEVLAITEQGKLAAALGKLTDD